MLYLIPKPSTSIVDFKNDKNIQQVWEVFRVWCIEKLSTMLCSCKRLAVLDEDFSIHLIFSTKKVKIKCQHNDKNYIDGEKRAYRTSEQLTETHSRRNWQKAPILPITRRSEALCLTITKILL
jgi:hypothetical protein